MGTSPSDNPQVKDYEDLLETIKEENVKLENKMNNIQEYSEIVINVEEKDQKITQDVNQEEDYHCPPIIEKTVIHHYGISLQNQVTC